MKKILCMALCLLLILSGCGREQAYVPTGDALEYDEDYSGPMVTPKEPEEQALTLTCHTDLGMNPYTCTDFTNRALFSLVYQGLFSVDRNYRAEPILCRQYAVSEDMRTYAFFLEDATFPGGIPVTAEDVAASLQAARAGAFYGGRFAHIRSITAQDGGVFISTDCPFEDLPLLLDIPIVPRDQTDAPWPAGSGAYQYANDGASISLQRRTDWWCKAKLSVTANKIPLLEAGSSTQIRDNFQFGGLNLVCADPGSDNYADYRCDYELWDCENGQFLYIAFSKNSKFFEDTSLRAAITYAVDRETIAATEYRGFARAASLPCSPLFPYYSTALASRFRYDPARFAQIIGEKGVAGTELTFLVNADDSLRLRVAKTIVQALNNGGLNVQLSALNTSAYLQAIRNRSFDLYLGQTSLSPNMDLSPFFDYNGQLSYGGVDEIGTYSLCMDALANHGNYYTLHKAVMENGGICPVLFSAYAVYATRGLLTGLTPARNNLFYYSLGKTMEEIRIS